MRTGFCRSVNWNDFTYGTGVCVAYFILATAAVFALSKSAGIDGLSNFSPVIGFALSLFLVVNTQRLAVTFSSAVTIAFSLYIANLYFDITYDGISYHQDAILNMAHRFSVFDSKVDGASSVVTSHYAKLSWLYGAAWYSVSGNMAITKSISVLLPISVFLTALVVLRGFGIWTMVIFSLVFALNPIVVNQIFSHYVDGPLGAFLTITVLGLYAYSRDTLIPSQSIPLILAGLLGVAALKLTGFVFSSIGILFFLYLFLQKRRLEVRKLLHWRVLSRRLLTRGVWLLALTGWRQVCFFVLVLFLLLNPYGRHVLDGKHIFHPAMGAEKSKTLVAGQTTPEFASLDPWSKLLISLFSQAETWGFWSKQPLPSAKIPLAIYPGELNALSSTGARSGGWGPLFGGVLLLTLVLVLAKLDYYKGYYAILVFLFFLSVVNPESWWARFNPQLYLLVTFALLATGLISLPYKVLTHILAVVLIVNSMLVFFPAFSRVMMVNAGVENRLRDVKRASIDGAVYWRASWFHIEPIFDRLQISHKKITDNIDPKEFRCDKVFQDKNKVFTEITACSKI